MLQKRLNSSDSASAKPKAAVDYRVLKGISMNQQNPIQPVNNDTIREQDKIHLVLAYISIFALIPLFTVKDSQFVQWHAKQGITLTACVFILAILFTGMGPLGLLNCPLALTIIVLDVVCIMKAFQGIRWRIPLIADWSEKFLKS